jgi:repressor LexA
MQPVPFYGKIAAGEPMLIPENRDRFITLDRAFVPSEDCFFLRVVGDSMIGRGIFDRDFVLVNPSARASDGDIIAARVGTEATVKTLQHRGATIVLEPANPDERELVIGPNDDFAVIGTIAAVFRPFHDIGEESDDAGAPPEVEAEAR